ncbi:hypothetical protein MJO29_013471, partial [Puccinia striiformis f. sp. tritici]
PLCQQSITMSGNNTRNIEVLQPKEAKKSPNPPEPNPNTGGGKVPNRESVQCQVASKKAGGENCRRVLKIDESGSIKSMIQHLKGIHGMLPPEKEKTNQLLLPNLMKRRPLQTRSTFSFQPTKNHLQQILKGMKYLSYTLDVWTSPNSKAFMAITIHGITSDWKMLDILVGMPAVY